MEGSHSSFVQQSPQRLTPIGIDSQSIESINSGVLEIDRSKLAGSIGREFYTKCVQHTLAHRDGRFVGRFGVTGSSTPHAITNVQETVVRLGLAIP